MDESELRSEVGGWRSEVRGQSLRSREHDVKFGGLEIWSFWTSGQALCSRLCFFSAPSFDYADMPSPLGESENTITVLLRPAQGRGAPIR